MRVLFVNEALSLFGSFRGYWGSESRGGGYGVGEKRRKQDGSWPRIDEQESGKAGEEMEIASELNGPWTGAINLRNGDSLLIGEIEDAVPSSLIRIGARRSHGHQRAPSQLGIYLSVACSSSRAQRRGGASNLRKVCPGMA